jgi:hypothetical protein
MGDGNISENLPPTHKYITISLLTLNKCKIIQRITGEKKIIL